MASFVGKSCRCLSRRASSVVPLHNTAFRSMVTQAVRTDVLAPVTDLRPFLARVAEVNNGLHNMADLVPFTLEGVTLGHLRQEFVQKLQQHSSVFQQQGTTLTLVPGLETLEERSEAVAGVLQQLRDGGSISGWRNELYPIATHFGRPPLLLLERAAAPFFGVRSYGVHINGYVLQPDGSMCLWVGRRSASKPTWPGKLDHIVAGGQPHGISCADNVVKECWEEAGVPCDIAGRARPVGLVSYVSRMPEGLKPDVLFCYDLQLPPTFKPVPQDGEVEEFMLWDLDTVAHVMAHTDDFKPNCCLVILDFLIRHGYFTPEQAGYAELVAALRAGTPC